MTRLEGQVVGLPGAAGPVGGALLVDGGRVTAFREGPAPRRLLLPGFVDLHVHGGGGADVMDGPEGVRAVAAFHLRRGTTALCPTTVTRPLDELRAFVAATGALEAGALEPGAARLLGVHLEGPFIDEARRGAQPPFTRPIDLAELASLVDAGPVATVTLAPELPGAVEAVRWLAARGVRASLGHSSCTYARAREAFAAGAGGVTHLFNAMSGLDHKRPGLAAAALEAEGAVLELILDGHHVHPALARLALRAARGRVALVTDAIRAAGLGDGESELGGQRVVVKDGRAALADGTLAGSVLTLDRALRLAVDLGLTVAEASLLLSRNPADALGRADLGRLTPGARADVVAVDPGSLAVEHVWLDGVEVTG
ncbi:MAG: N-acetylglucosamine-6-phosphate deacetylase [Planctomycetes bacterium]|nr:N-acetylglucosamine-6-phosphate deacetylase [Planctomycetota bacterium]